VTAPSFLSTGFATVSLPGTTVDVTDIINAVATLLTTTLSATPTPLYPSGERWTSLGGGAYQSPLDSAGRWMKLILTRTSATRLKWDLYDPTGQVMNGVSGGTNCGEIDIAAGGSVVNIFGGPAHIVVEANNAGTWETAMGVITDPSPEPLASSNVYVWGRARRDTTSGVVANSQNLQYWLGRFMNGTTAGYNNLGAIVAMPSQFTTASHLRTQAGSEVAAPQYITPWLGSGSVPGLNAGRLYQHVIVDGNQVPGVDLNIPIDTGLTGQFHVLQIGTGGNQLAVRKA
jgi:hypothetical protein